MYLIRIRYGAVLLALAMVSANSALAADAPVNALVRVAPLARHVLTENLVGYGVVSAAVGDETGIALPRAGRVLRLAVTAGQVVKKGDELFEFGTDAADSLAYQQARSAEQLARRDLQRTESLFSQQLVTAAQLDAARKTLRDAENARAAQVRLGSAKSVSRVTAPYDAVVTIVSAHQGDFLAVGAPVLRLQKSGSQWVQIGVEPEDALRIKVGMPVRIVSVFNPVLAVATQVSAVHGALDPQTRLIAVAARLDTAKVRFFPGTRVRAEITLTTQNVVAVPRATVLRDARGSYLFQIKDGKARRVDVRTGLESQGLVAVTGALDAALPVVIQGNYELENGMAVREAQR